VRRFNFFNYTNNKPEIERLGQNPDVTVRFRGVMEKCTYCTQRISETRIKAKLENNRPISDEVVTACQQACPAGAISFGNLNDEDSTVVKHKAEDRNYVLLGYLNIRPRTSYLAKITNPNSELAGS
jgi:molybdopterin-containing oxidoreductase family iron-sulfur binding subunit